MWSPLGRENMADYYPGDDVVGLSVFSYQPWEGEILGQSLSFAEIFGPRYDRAVEFGKPVMVAELGSVGDAEHVASENADIATMGDAYPELAAVGYFGQQGVYPWPAGFDLPNWRQTAHILD